MKYIGVDLHTNSFTVYYLEEGKSERIENPCLQVSHLERFINSLETDNSCFFCDQVSPYVSRVVVISPSQFDVIRSSVKKKDKVDARAIASFLSKDILPKSHIKKTKHIQLASLIQTWEQLVRLCVSFINKVHSLFNRFGIKIKKEILTTQKDLEKSVKARMWEALERIEIDIITEHLESLSKGISALLSPILLSIIWKISDFVKTANLAAYLDIVLRISQSNDQHLVERIIKRGSQTLVQCTFIAKRYSSYLLFTSISKQKEETEKPSSQLPENSFNIIFYTLKDDWMFKDFPPFKLSSKQLL